MEELTNLINGQRVPVLHGENFMRRVDVLPAGNTTKTNLYIVGHSESGHNHVLKAKTDMEVLEADGRRFVLLKEVGRLFNQKTFDIHETVLVGPGVYEITHKTEYDPFKKVTRAIYD